jgi:hypothetical protein
VRICHWISGLTSGYLRPGIKLLRTDATSWRSVVNLVSFLDRLRAFSKLLSAESNLDMICFDRVGKKNENPVRFLVKEITL